MGATRFVIMPPSWAGASSHVCRTLSRGSKGESAWVALARVGDDKELSFIPSDGVSQGQKKSLVAEAQAHLDAQSTSWDVSEMTSGFLGFFKKPALVAATGGVDMELLGGPKDRVRYGITMKLASVFVADDYSPERVLSPKALMTAHEMLQASDLIAVLPKRGMLLLGRGQAGELPAMLKMNEIVKGVFGRAGELAVSPVGLFVKDGKIIGVNGEGYLSLFPTDTDPWGPSW